MSPSPLYPARVSLLWGLGEVGRGHHALPSSTTSLSSGHHAAMATARPPQEEALTSRSMGSAPRGLQLSLGAQRGGGQGEAGPSALRGDFCGFQEKGGYALRSGGTEGAGFDLPATWALYCLCFFETTKVQGVFCTFLHFVFLVGFCVFFETCFLGFLAEYMA